MSFRIGSFEPFLTRLVYSFGLQEALVCISPRCECEASQSTVSRVDIRGALAGTDAKSGDALRVVKPNLILMSLDSRLESDEEVQDWERETATTLQRLWGLEARVLGFWPSRLDDIFRMWERIGSVTGASVRSRELIQRFRSQCMDWCDNFYDRMKNKRVAVVSSIEPLRLAGRWVPDLIAMAGAIAVTGSGDRGDSSFGQLVEMKPDVLVVAPEGMPLAESLKTFRLFESQSGWEALPAVRRGEVFFTDGIEHFYCPDMRLLESMSILVSAMAGMDSGYISKRDIFYRLRWLELQRHRL